LLWYELLDTDVPTFAAFTAFRGHEATTWLFKKASAIASTNWLSTSGGI